MDRYKEEFPNQKKPTYKNFDRFLVLCDYHGNIVGEFIPENIIDVKCEFCPSDYKPLTTSVRQKH